MVFLQWCAVGCTPRCAALACCRLRHQPQGHTVLKLRARPLRLCAGVSVVGGGRPEGFSFEPVAGHGKQIIDSTGEEEDGMSEAIVLHRDGPDSDCQDWLLTDIELNELLVRPLKEVRPASVPKGHRFRPYSPTGCCAFSRVTTAAHTPSY